MTLRSELFGLLDHMEPLEESRHSDPDIAGCESCAQCAAFEFQPENIAPLYKNRAHFLKSQWNIPWPVYVGYRILVAALISAWITADYLDEASKFYSQNYGLWMIFATNWSFLLLGVSAMMHAVIVTVHFVKSKWGRTDETSVEDGQRGLDVPMMIFWIIHSCSFNGALVVTFSYWGFLFSVTQAGFLITRMSRLKHTLNTVYVLVDLMISGVPIRVFHVVYPLFIGAIYTVFNVVYFTNDGTGPNGHPYAYDMINWQSNPLESALACSMVFVLSSVMQGILYGVYRLRLFIHGHVMHVRYDVIAMEHGDLLTREPSGSESEVENILGANRNRAVSYSSTETMEREVTTSGEPKEDGLVAMTTGDVTVVVGCDEQVNKNDL